MKKLVFVALAVVLVLTLGTSAVLAKGQSDTPANDNPNNLYLYEKDADWNIVWDGAWGKMTWNTAGDVKFNGHGLVAGTDYTLVIYNGWPSVTVIGSGIANKGGNVNIKGAVSGLEDAKIWLVLSDDLTDDAFNAWNPSEYLFEHNLVTIP